MWLERLPAVGNIDFTTVSMLEGPWLFFIEWEKVFCTGNAVEGN